MWIDALCILQDSREDWELESAAMSDIYSHAFCTIAAAATKHCEGGMLLRADRRRFSVMTLADNLFVKASTIPHQDLKDSNPLSTRAWALQEHELSPRVLWFTAHELLFECHAMWGSEEYPDCDNHPSDSTGVLDRIFDCHTLNGDGLLYHHRKSLSLGGIYLTWRRIVERYSSRLLGLAHEIQAAYGSEYAAGIWIDDLPRALLWTSNPRYSRMHFPLQLTNPLRLEPTVHLLHLVLLTLQSNRLRCEQQNSNGSIGDSRLCHQRVRASP
jgi:hypothetical protein